jgi:hypothetical protein
MVRRHMELGRACWIVSAMRRKEPHPPSEPSVNGVLLAGQCPVLLQGGSKPTF